MATAGRMPDFTLLQYDPIRSIVTFSRKGHFLMFDGHQRCARVPSRAPLVRSFTGCSAPAMRGSCLVNHCGEQLKSQPSKRT